MNNQIELFEKLMVPGRFILPRVRPNGKSGYCLYEGKMNPVITISNSSFKKVKNYLKDKDGVMTIDLRKIRSMHGNSGFKRKYKDIRNKQTLTQNQ